MLNLRIHLPWASSRQHECGIKQNKLSDESMLPSVMLGWVTTFVCPCLLVWDIYLYLSILYTRICVYEFMNKTWFSGLTVSRRRPQAGGMYWLGHLFSYKWGVHCWFCVCSSAASSFIRKYFSQHISIKSTQTRYMYSFMAQAGYHNH